MKRIILLIILFVSFATAYSQVDEKLSPEEKARREKNIQAGNPFKKYGYYPKIATLSKGKYLEFHDLDTIVRIGSFTFNTNTMKIVGYNRIDESDDESMPRPDLISRWFSPDPLSEEFPSWSPYNFSLNNPIRFIDSDGRASEDIIFKASNKSTLDKTLQVINENLGGDYASLDKNGKLQLSVSRDDLKTDEQKAFYDTLIEGVNAEYDVNIFVVDNDQIIDTDDFDQKVMDIGDIDNYGNEDKLVNKKTMMAHVIAEQTAYQKDTENVTYNEAHQAGLAAEKKINGGWDRQRGKRKNTIVTRVTDNYRGFTRTGPSVSYTWIVPFVKDNKKCIRKIKIVNSNVVKRP